MRRMNPGTGEHFRPTAFIRPGMVSSKYRVCMTCFILST